MSQLKLLPLALTMVVAVNGCKGDDDNNGTRDAGDSGPPDTGEPPDSGVHEDAAPIDTGPGPCQHDQGGPDTNGCEPGEVCNLSMDPPMCVPGKPCTTTGDCIACSDLVNPEDCGHGYHLTAWCDPEHGNVCTRSRAPCEPCGDDDDCGPVHPLFGGMNTCVDYGSGEKYCGRPCTQGCPDGFTCDDVDENGTDECSRPIQGCAAKPVICELDPDSCPGLGMSPTQICPGETCEGTGGARCSTNDQPGALGICIGFCTQNSDCTDAAFPICNTRNGICIAGCTQGSCPAGQVCHVDGFCAPPCDEDVDCTDEPRYGPNTYCNLPPPSRPPPRYYKGSYRDDFSCAPLGCERKVDCAEAGVVCDKTQLPPACVPGCYERMDCSADKRCKQGEQRNYSEQECRMLPTKPENEDEIGVCCDPGCEDLEFDCGFNQWCCGEEGIDPSLVPYSDPASCLPVTSTAATQALPGECFDMDAATWCRHCMSNDECNMPRSGWVTGFGDVDGSGNLVNEQEFCSFISMSDALCSVTCNPDVVLEGNHTCPRLWRCEAHLIPCFQDADCNGLTCIGADQANMIPGACRCGENGAPTATCPMSTLEGGVDAPRCIEVGDKGLQVRMSNPGEFYCVAAFNCMPPFLQVINQQTGDTNYPASCGFDP